MIGRFVRAMRVVLPRWQILLLLLLIGVAVEFYVASLARDGVHVLSPFDAYLPRWAFVLVVALVYGVYRVFEFHPFGDPAYYDWLLQTPWTAVKPLPLGPVYLVWPDLLIVGGLVLAVRPGTILESLVIPTVFLATYLVCLTITFGERSQRPYLYLLVFLFGLVARTLAWPYAVPAVMAFAYVASQLGIRQTLRGLHERTSQYVLVESKRRRVQRLGWPFDRLGPRDIASSLGFADALGIALIGTWSMYVVMWFVTVLSFDTPVAELESGLWIGLVLALSAAAILRAGFYFAVPSLGLAARLATRRLIDPGFDCVLLAPVGAWMIGLITSSSLATVGLPSLYAYPVAFFVAALILMRGPPSLRDWRLTGHYRLLPPLTSTNDLVRL